jgi:Phosphoribulokinase
MSTKHPIIAITGSSGAGTTSVTRSFQRIFHRESLKAAVIEGDSFHRYDRKGMRVAMAEAEKAGNHHFSHFGPEANLLEELENTFREYGETGNGVPASTCMMRKRRPPMVRSRARSRPGNVSRKIPTCCSTKACTAER